MHRTFEELASHEIDRLYKGALFLEAGRGQEAEDLLLSTLTAAFSAFRRVEEGTDPARWLEGRLAQAYLAATGSVDAEDVTAEEIEGAPPELMNGVEIDPPSLYKAARKVPPRARAALWLVLLRRWKYTEASRVLGTDVDDLKGLLAYRHLLLSAVLHGPEERDGTNGEVM